MVFVLIEEIKFWRRFWSLIWKVFQIVQVHFLHKRTSSQVEYSLITITLCHSYWIWKIYYVIVSKVIFKDFCFLSIDFMHHLGLHYTTKCMQIPQSHVTNLVGKLLLRGNSTIKKLTKSFLKFQLKTILSLFSPYTRNFHFHTCKLSSTLLELLENWQRR